MLKTKSCYLKGPLCYLVSILVVAFCFMHTQRQEKQAVKEVIEIDSQAIASLSIVAHTQATNAHILLQIINKLEGNDDQIKPLESTFNMGNLEVIDELDIDVSIDQIKTDVIEIDQGIRTIAANNLFQRQSLELILLKLQD